MAGLGAAGRACREWTRSTRWTRPTRWTWPTPWRRGTWSTPSTPWTRRVRSGPWRYARWVRPVRGAACVVAVLCVAALAGAATLRATVLERGFYQGVLDDSRAYDRLYDEVLVDPESRPLTRDLLERLPVPGAVLTANVKTVLPPATARELTDEQLAVLTRYLRGDTDRLGVSVDLRPVLANIGELAKVYLGDLVTRRGAPEDDMSQALNRAQTALEDVAAGRKPAGVPEVKLSNKAVDKVSSALLSRVPEGDRDALRPQVEGALGAGDTGTALAAVGPYLVGDAVGHGDGGKRGLLRITDHGTRWDVVDDLAGAGVDTAALDEVRAVTGPTEGLVQTLAVTGGLLSLAFLWVSAPTRARTRKLRTVGWVLAAGGALPAAVFAVLRWRGGDLAWRPPSPWPSSLEALVADLQIHAVQSFTAAGLSAAATPLVMGVLLHAALAVRQRHRAVREALRGLPRRTRTRLLGVSAAGSAAMIVLGVVVAPAAAGEASGTYCNGSAEMCDLRYDQAAYLATHNSMSTTEDRFVSPLQDVGITAQLDGGARALLIDTHTWERSDQITDRLKLSDVSPGMRERIKGVVDRTGPPRPGLWLCHAVCRGGALPLVDTLREIRRWMDRHPDEVVTLIVQNGISGERTRAAFRQAGLQRLLFTPDADPAARWPTLGDMVEDGRRLVVFSEGRGGPAPWYREFYDYGMETPYDFRTPQSMNCAPHRGGSDKRLFLLNHFVTDGGGSRIDAGEVNTSAFVRDRARNCEAQRGRPVTFVAVDFANLGDAAGAVRALNEERGG